MYGVISRDHRQALVDHKSKLWRKIENRNGPTVIIAARDCVGEHDCSGEGPGGEVSQQARQLAFGSTKSCILSTVVAQTLAHRFSLDPIKLEHETARNDVSKSGEDLRVQVFSGCTPPPKLQRNAFKDCRWYDDGSP